MSKRRRSRLKRANNSRTDPVGPTSGHGLIVFAAASFLKDAVNRVGDIMDDGKPNDSFKT